MKRNVDLDFALLPKELKLILSIIRFQQDYHPSIDEENSLKDIQWDYFLQLVKHHRLFPSLYPKMSTMKENQIPKIITQKVYQLYQRNIFQMLHLSKELIYIYNLFQDDRIRMLLLKGPTLAQNLYGDISLRTSNDIDMLVPIQELGKVDKLLTMNGYVKDDYILSVLGDWKWRHHHVTYFHFEKNIKIEIHWRLNPGPAKEPSFNELWERKEICTLSNFPIYMLGKEDLFLFLVTHGARHGWSRLRWLMDISQIVEQKAIDWEKANKLMRKNQSQHLGGQALILASELFNVELDNEMRKIVKGKKPRKIAQDALFYLKQMVNLHTFPVPKDVSKYHKHYLFIIMSIHQKMLFILSYLFPYPEDALVLPLPKLFHFLYFPLRPILWAYRKTRKHVMP